MTDQEQFLALYKQYEGILRKQDRTYKEVEDSLEDDVLKNQMYFMRQMRNYLSHNADIMFVAVSGSQTDLLNRLIQAERRKEAVVSKNLYSLKTAACREGDLIHDVIVRMAKLKVSRLPVVNEADRLLGTVSIYKLAVKDASQPLSRKSYGLYGKDAECIKPDTSEALAWSLKEHTGAVICCTPGGKPKETVLGVWKGGLS